MQSPRLRPYKPGRYGRGTIQSETAPVVWLWRVKGWHGTPRHEDVQRLLGLPVRDSIDLHVDKLRRFYFHRPGSGHVVPRDPAKLARAVVAQHPVLTWGRSSVEEFEQAHNIPGAKRTLAMAGRPLRDFEQGAHLHVLDWAHSTARQRLQAAGQVQVKAAAKTCALDPPGLCPGPPHLPALEAAMHHEMQNLYALGHATVRSELDHQAHGSQPAIGLSQTILLDAGEGPDLTGHLAARAGLIAGAVSHTIYQAMSGGFLNGIVDKRSLRRIGRDAGNRELANQASLHAGGAIAAGRRHAAHNSQAQVMGARYTSVLDKNTCGPCADADTGELIPLDSPEWVPTPNPACEGGARCRCIHVYQLASEQVPIAAGH